MRKYKLRKKGSLNLSVNAIVVLIMAITMLGLGLSFIRDKFGSAGSLVDDVQQKVKDSIMEDFASGSAKVSFPKTTFKMDNSDEYVAAMGIKNMEESPVNFVVKLEPKNDVTRAAVSGENLEFQYFSSYPDVAVDDYRIVPIKILTHGLDSQTTYFIRLNVCIDHDSDEHCTPNQDPAEEYAQKEFFIEIV